MRRLERRKCKVVLGFWPRKKPICIWISALDDEGMRQRDQCCSSSLLFPGRHRALQTPDRALRPRPAPPDREQMRCRYTWVRIARIVTPKQQSRSFGFVMLTASKEILVDRRIILQVNRDSWIMARVAGILGAPMRSRRCCGFCLALPLIPWF